MTTTDPIQRACSGLYGNLSAALVTVSTYTVVAAAVLWWVNDIPTTVRIPLAFPLLVFTPGYAIVSAVFPADRLPTTGSDEGPLADQANYRDLSALERVAVAIIASIAVVPAIALVTSTIAGVTAGPIMAGVVVVTLVASGIGIYRRRHIRPVAKEPRRTSTSEPRLNLRGALTRGTTLVAIGLVLVLLVSSAALSIADNGSDSPMTEFYLVNESDIGTDQRANSATPYRLRITQHSDEPQQYSLVIMLDQDQGGANELLGQDTLVTPPGETIEKTYRPLPEDVPSEFTLRFLLYRGETPSNPTVNSAYRTLRVVNNSTSE